MTSNFIRGAINSALAHARWPAGGWTAITLTGRALAVIRLSVRAGSRRGPLLAPHPVDAEG